MTVKRIKGKEKRGEGREKLPEVLNTLIGEVVVVPHPGEVLANIPTRGEGLHGLDHVQVLDVKEVVLGTVEVLAGHHDTLCCGGGGEREREREREGEGEGREWKRRDEKKGGGGMGASNVSVSFFFVVMGGDKGGP